MPKPPQKTRVTAEIRTEPIIIVEEDPFSQFEGRSMRLTLPEAQILYEQLDSMIQAMESASIHLPPPPEEPASNRMPPR